MIVRFVTGEQLNLVVGAPLTGMFFTHMLLTLEDTLDMQTPVNAVWIADALSRLVPADALLPASQPLVH